jgi:hypothetical protein
MSSHFYSQTTGELIEGGLREARKVSGLPSPTTVLGLIKGEGLIRYFKRQAWEAAVTTPRLPGMSDEDHFQACLRWADEHSKIARERGGDFHTLCQRFHLSTMGEGDGLFEVPKAFALQFDAYLKWYETYVQNTVACEQFVLGQGYAGRLDHLALLKDGRLAVCDVKTQSLAKSKSVTFYPSFFVQLGAYAGALPSPADVLVSVVVSADINPVVVEAKYSERPVSYYHQLFLGLLEVWMHENRYWPTPNVNLVTA